MMRVVFLNHSIKYFWGILLISLSLNAQPSEAHINSDQDKIDHQLWDNLLKRHVSDQGRVDYSSFLLDIAQVNRYIQGLAKSADGINNRSKEEQLAFWINAYNACTVKLI